MKTIALPFLVLLCALPALAADMVEVRVTGRGIDQEAALHDAFRKATRQVFGTFVISKTVTDKAILTEDRVITLSQGFVDHYAVMDKYDLDGLVILDVKVALAKLQVKQQATKLGLVNWESYLGGLSSLQQIQVKRRMQAQAFQSLVGDPENFVQRAFRFDIVGLEIADIGPDHIDGDLLIQVTRNELFFQQYEQLLSVVEVSDEKPIIDGLIRSPAEAMPHYTMHGQVQIYKPINIPHGDLKPLLIQKNPFAEFSGLAIVDGYRIPDSLKDLLPTRLLEVDLRIGTQRHRIGVLKNAIILNGLPQDLTKFHITHLLPDSPETGVTGFSKSLTSGGIYTTYRDPTVIVTKDSFRFRFPFRVKNAEQVRGLTKQPVTFAVTGSKAITVSKYRFVGRNSYFVAEN